MGGTAMRHIKPQLQKTVGNKKILSLKSRGVFSNDIIDRFSYDLPTFEQPSSHKHRKITYICDHKATKFTGCVLTDARTFM